MKNKTRTTSTEAKATMKRHDKPNYRNVKVVGEIDKSLYTTDISDTILFNADNTTDERNIVDHRAETHGDFASNAKVSQKLKTVVRESAHYENLTYEEREAIDMILHKIARIVSSRVHFIDHWRDLIGYSELVVRKLKKTSGAMDVETTVIKNEHGHTWIKIK